MHTTPDSAPHGKQENFFAAGLEFVDQHKGRTAGLAALALTGSVLAGIGMNYETIDTATGRIDGGGTRTAVANLSAELAEKHAIPFDDIARVDSEGINLGIELTHETGDVAGTDDIVSVSLEKNAFGYVRIDADYVASTPSPDA